MTALPVIVSGLMVAFRVNAGNWSDAVHQLVASPYTWLALLIYVGFVGSAPHRGASATGGLRSVAAAVYWLGAGQLQLLCALCVELFPGRWYEVVADAALVISAAACLGDFWKRVTGWGVSATVGEPTAERRD